MTYFYDRSDIVSFYELTEDQQKENISLLDQQIAEDTSYVILKNEALPLCMFMRTNSKFIHGVYVISNTSAYTVTLSRCNSEAVVAYGG
jgi:hypothetical protein